MEVFTLPDSTIYRQVELIRVEIVMASPHIDMLRPSWRCIHSRAKAVTESCRAILQSQ